MILLISNLRKKIKLREAKGEFMAKGRDTQKSVKKKSEKTLKEKRKEKKDKKAQKGKVSNTA